jgi:hypothetical protein
VGGRNLQQLTVYDRAGNILARIGEPADYLPSIAVFSPDGTRLAFARRSPFQIWVYDFATGDSRQITSGQGVKYQVAWSPDGSQIAFVARRDGYDGIYRIASDGTGVEELLYGHTLGVNLWGSLDWSRDGRFLCFESGGVLFLLALDGDRRAVELLREEYNVTQGRFFPDGRFFAYTSDESGRNEIYVRSFDGATGTFPADGGKWRISADGGGVSLLPRNVGELAYVGADGGVMAVKLTDTPGFAASPPMLLFRPPVVTTNLAATSPDGAKFAFFVFQPPPERPVVAVAPEILAKYAGIYSTGSFDEDADRVITLEGHQLMMQIGGNKVPLYAVSDTYFFAREPHTDTDYQFVEGENGVVSLMNGRGTFAWTRK